MAYTDKCVVEISRPDTFTKCDDTKSTVIMRKSVRTSLSLIYLNKLLIADVLIDLIKDYLYISKEEVLKKFYKDSINMSIAGLVIDRHYFVDIFGRRRQARVQWMEMDEGLHLHHFLCVTCGENGDAHAYNGCCEMELDGDGEDDDEVLELVLERDEEGRVVDEEGRIEVEREKEYHLDEVSSYEQDPYDGYDSDNWYAG
jgi:hypothetical protein